MRKLAIFFEPYGVILTVFGLCASLAIYFDEAADREAERILRAWEVLTSENKNMARSSAKKSAIEYLHSFNQPSFCLPNSEKFCLVPKKEHLFQGLDLIKINLAFANLSGANFWEADLSGANLGRADLSGANLRFANLSGTILEEANLSGANLAFANLSEANLAFANLSGANLWKADLNGANFDKAFYCPGHPPENENIDSKILNLLEAVIRCDASMKPNPSEF